MTSPYLPPTDSDLLIQARTAGARAYVFAEVRMGVATARLVGLDGRERDRKTVAISGDLAPLADAITELLQPESKRRWYQSKWAWVAGGAIGAAIILVPLTTFLANDNGSSTTTYKLPLPPGTW